MVVSWLNGFGTEFVHLSPSMQGEFSTNSYCILIRLLHSSWTSDEAERENVDRSHRDIFPFPRGWQSPVTRVHQAAVLGNVKLCLMLSDVLDAICFYLDVRIHHPLLS